MQQKCNVCGDSLTTLFKEVRDPQTNDIFSIEICARCGLGHTMPLPKELGRYYAAGYYGNRHGFTARFCSKRRLAYVRTVMGDGVGQRLLDVGCGDGSFLMEARRAGWKVMGTELNPSMARKEGLDVRENIERLENEGTFDCITMWHTLEHMRDIASMLKRIVRLLGPDGKLIVAVPDCGGMQAKIFRERWLHLDVPRHLYHFDRGSLQYCLASAGFSVKKKWHMEFEYDLLGWTQSALNYLMPHPNIFFDTITGKRTGRSAAVTATAFALGVLLTVLALPAVIAGTLLGRGGTLVVVAEKK